MHVSSSELVALPAGPLGFAAGIEHRRESGADLLDPLEISGNANGNGVTNGSTSGAYSVTEAVCRTRCAPASGASLSHASSI